MKKTSVIPAGVTLVGDIEGDADLVVLGRVDGPIHIGGALVIEEGGQVRGHVRGRTVTVRGVLKGDAYGEETVRVDESARLVGELTAPRVKVAVGARFRGQMHVGEVGEPRLRSYDPKLHTFTGAPAPRMVEGPPTLSEATAPMSSMTVPAPPPPFVDDDAPTLSEATAAHSEPPPPEPRKRAEPPDQAEPPEQAEPQRFRMPVLARARGKRRTRG